MDQLVVLQEIYESFAKGNDSLHKIDAKSITGNCAPQISKLLDSIVQGETDKDVCLKLAQCLTDLYELKRLGDICRRAGLLDVAIICYNKSLSSSKDTQVRSVLMNNLGQVYVRKGDLSRAVLYYKKAVEGFEAVGDNGGTAHVLGNLGSAYRRAYDWDKSVASFFKSLKLFEKAGDELGAAQMTGSLGRVYAEMGELDLAVLYFERSLKEFEGLGDKRSAAWVLNRLGKVKAESRNWDGSEGAFNRSLALFDEIGQPHNSGTVLSNLGRMYLDKGELNRARDSLERSLQLIRRDMLPVYPNTLSCLGATYAALAKDHWQGADEDEILKPRRTDKDQKEALNLASKLYTHAADSLTDLSQHSKVFLPDVKISASIARSLSYLVLLLNNPRDEEAVSLAKRAISAMQEASANSEGAEKDKLEALKRTLMGTMGIWSIGLLKNEPWGMIKTLGESVEYLMGGGRALSSAEGRISQEAFRSISLALQDLSSALEADRQRCGSGDQIKTAISHLKRAEKQFERSGSALAKDCASKVNRAALSLQRLTDPSFEGQSKANISDLLNFGPHRNALLLLGFVLVKNLLQELDKTGWIYVWDDSMNLVEMGPSEQQHARKKIRTSVKLEDLSDINVEPSLEEVLEGARGVAQSQALEPDFQVSKNINWDGQSGLLVPVTADCGPSSCTSLLLRPSMKDVRHGSSADQSRIFTDPLEQDQEEIFYQPLSHEVVDSPSYQKANRRPSRWHSNLLQMKLPSDGVNLGVTAAKILGVVVVLLLAVDLILYLI